MKNLPVYKHPASYAREHDELAAYRASNQANAACKEAIEAAIRDHYRDNRLDAAAVDQVVQQFGYDRAFYILAITVCQADWDRRYFTRQPGMDKRHVHPRQSRHMGY